jgi:hypothetical protein
MQRPAVLLNRLGKFVLIPIGVLLLLGTAFSVWSTKAWLARTVEVRGAVIEMVRVRDRDSGGYLFTPLVRFETRDGKTIEFQSGLRTNPPAHHAGQTVPVLYDPDAPHSAAIKGLFSLWLASIVLCFIGCVVLTIGTAMVLLSGRVARILEERSVSA